MKLIDFYADWCSPCKMQGELLQSFDSVEIEPVNVENEENESLCEEYGVKSLPTLVLLDDDNEMIKEWHGLTHPDEILKYITKD